MKKTHWWILYSDTIFYNTYRLIGYLVVMKCYSKVSKKDYLQDCKEKTKEIVVMDNKEQKIRVN